MTKKRKIYVTISWIAVAACMGFIFYMSSRVSTESQAMSDSVLKGIFGLIGIEFPVIVIRKGAHMTEFAGLAMLIFNAVYATWKPKMTPLIAFAATAMYAVTDEFHQIFVEGRGPKFTDVLVDSSGAIIGIIISIIILKIIKIILERGNKIGNTQTL